MKKFNFLIVLTCFCVQVSYANEIKNSSEKKYEERLKIVEPEVKTGDEFLKENEDAKQSSESIKELIQNNIYVYPNPLKKELFINLGKQHGVKRLQIISVSDKMIYSSDKVQTNEGIDLSEIDNGIYLAKIYTETGVVVLKFVKQ